MLLPSLAATGMFLSGCGTTLPPSGEWKDLRVEPSPFLAVGTVTLVDKDTATAVVRLFDVHTQLSQPLYSRTPQLDFTAQLRPTGLRTGRSVGVVIRRGAPAPGEEVVVQPLP
ncbi:MAG: hypothetical protein F7O42_04970 [Opitutae bacterium]|nr:hypothetical protein [Opitutae bacterium]